MKNNLEVTRHLEISQAIFKDNVSYLIKQETIKFPFLLIEGELLKSQALLLKEIIPNTQEGIQLCIVLQGKLFKLKSIDTCIKTINKIHTILEKDLRFQLDEMSAIHINPQKMLELGLLDLKDLYKEIEGTKDVESNN